MKGENRYSLKRKLNNVKQTMDYKKYELKEKKGYKWINLDKNKALTGIQKRYKANVSDEQSAFKNYANWYSITDIKVKRNLNITISKISKRQF